MECRRRRPRRRPRRLHGRDPRGAAGREGRRASRRSPSSAAPACASGASRPRRGCRPRSSASGAEETFAKLGVQVGEPQLDFAAANEWKDGVVKQMTGGVASLFKANGVEWVKGAGTLQGREHDRGRGRRGRHASSSAIIATGSFPLRPPIPGLESTSCVDSTGLLAQTEVPRRLVDPRRRHHRLRVRLDLPPLRLRGDGHRDARHADPAGGRGRGEGAREAVRQARHQRCSSASSARGSSRRGERAAVSSATATTVDCDLMLVSVGRGPLVEGLGLEAVGVEFDKRKGIAADEHRRTDRPAHLRGRRLRRLLAARAHGVPRGRGRGRERDGSRRRRRQPRRCRVRSTPTRRSPASA